jgi:homoserine kinase type II
MGAQAAKTLPVFLFWENTRTFFPVCSFSWYDREKLLSLWGRGATIMDERIVADLRESYGITFSRIEPVRGGYLNRKWRVSTEQGELLIKQYSPARYSGSRFDEMEDCLQRQILLHDSGVACPRLLTRDGRVIRRLADEIAYMVMEFCTGQTQNADETTPAQMRDLGSACAVMHKAFAALPPPADKALPRFGSFSPEALEAYITSGLRDCPDPAPPGYRPALLAVAQILDKLCPTLFSQSPQNYAHEDFQAGNILFNREGVSAIVDFDRNGYSYPWHDIGRAVLSFALEEQTLHTGKVRAFLEGYTRHLPLSPHNIADALRLTLCIETSWWIRPEYIVPCDEIPARFRDEILWLIARWEDLGSIIGSI